MSEIYSASYLPQLHPIALTDWLPKLGEKAFLSWLHFHSWKLEHYSSGTGNLLPFSLNKIIRKLGVGKATFYEKIIQPLKAFGLIKVIASESSRQEYRLIVYTYPYNCPENAEKPLQPDQLDNSYSDSEVKPISPQTPTILPRETVSCQFENSSTSELEVVPNQHQSGTESVPVLSIYKDHLLIDTYDLDYKEKEKEKEIINHSSDHDHLPEELKNIMTMNRLFYDRSDQILKVFETCKNHPSYTLDSFLIKLHHCIQYPHDPKYFSFYLHRSLLNEWERHPKTKRQME